MFTHSDAYLSWNNMNTVICILCLMKMKVWKGRVTDREDRRLIVEEAKVQRFRRSFNRSVYLTNLYFSHIINHMKGIFLSIRTHLVNSKSKRKCWNWFGKRFYLFNDFCFKFNLNHNNNTVLALLCWQSS